MKRHSQRLCLEPLEDRRLLSTCHVVRLSDAGAGFGFRGDLRYCINKVNANPGADTIDFRVTGTINLTGALPDLATDMDILGPGATELIVRRSTGGNYRIFTVGTGTKVRIAGLTATNGYDTSGQGGGIHNSGSLTISQARVTANQVVANSALGGGILNAAYLKVEQSQVTNNVATNPWGFYSVYAAGGGIYNANNATLILTESTLSNNRAHTNSTYGEFTDGHGGGAYNAGTMTVLHSTIANNVVDCSGTYPLGAGGGVYSTNKPLTIEYSTIRDNSAGAGGHYAYGYGGGVYGGLPLIISHSTISGNTAAAGGDSDWSYGGGIVGAGTITNSSIVNNKVFGLYRGASGISGGGTILHSTIAGNNFEGISFTGALTLRNSIVANNALSDVEGNITNSGYNLIGNSAGGSGYVPSDILDVDPMLGPLADTGGPTLTMSLLAGSLAIDSGTNQMAPEWDQRGPGFPRIVNGTIDRGAFEVQATSAPTAPDDFAFLITPKIDDDD